MKYSILGLIGIFAAACISIDKRSFCRIGMSTQVEKRIKYWKNRCTKQGVKILSHKVLKVFDSKKEAQEYETHQAKEQKCIAHPGGSGPQKAKWTIYRLDMTGSC